MTSKGYTLTVEGSEDGTYDGRWTFDTEAEAMAYGSHIADTELHAVGENLADITIRTADHFDAYGNPCEASGPCDCFDPFAGLDVPFTDESNG